MLKSPSAVPNLLFALFVAVLVPSVVLGLIGLSPLLFLYLAVIASMHAIFLALPSILILKKFKAFNIYTTLVCGFIFGAIPFGIWSFPESRIEMKTTSYISGFGQTMIEGVVTNAGWAQYFVVVSILGTTGLIIAAIFWATLSYLQRGQY